MAKELYLYSPIYDFVAQDLIAAMEENAGEDIVIRINTPGGSVFSGWGIIAKMLERDGKTKIKLDGAAMSMGSLIIAFADDVEALDVSTIMLHRADMQVDNEGDQAFLDKVNNDLRRKLEAKIDKQKLKELKGITISDLFADDKRIDLYLSAKEAQQIGLVNKITKIVPKELSAFNKMFAIAAEHNPKDENKPPLKNNNMNLETLKAENPGLYNQIFALGVTQGIADEKDRVSACLVFNEIDPVAVKSAIESGKPLTQTQIAEFSLKAVSGKSLENVKKESAKIVTPGAAPSAEQTDDANELSAFAALVHKELGTKKIV